MAGRMAVFMVLVAALGRASAGSAEPLAVAAPARELSHAVIISIDSLRADHLPMYGYPRMTTPFLARLVGEGRAQVYERFTAIAPSCNPSHSAMLTGLYPQQIGLPLCGEDLVFKHADADDEEQMQEIMEYQSLLRRTPEPLIRKKVSTVKSWLSIPEGTQTLATFLDEEGYLTGGFVSIWTIDRRFGYAWGFDRFEDRMAEYYGPRGLKWLLGKTFNSQKRQPAEETLEHALDFLNSREPGENIFIFMNLADTHIPYSAPEGIFFEEGPQERRILEEHRRSRYPEADYARAMKRMSQGGEPMLDAYDRSIKYTDSLIERFFDRLEELDLLADTLVLITTDHGESMGQHRYLPPASRNGLFFEHSVYVWEETQHAPLIVHDPRRPRSDGARPANVSHIDLVPTVLEALGYHEEDFGAGPLPGAALGDIRDGARRVHFLTYGRGSPGILKGRKLDYPGYIGFREGDLKFFVDRKRFRRESEGRCFLYDLAVDPHEMNNLCERNETGPQASRYRDELVEWYNSTAATRSDLRKKR